MQINTSNIVANVSVHSNVLLNTAPDRNSSAVVDPGVIATEDVKLAAIESLRMEDRVLVREISVSFNDDVTDEVRDSILNEYKLEVLDTIPELGFYRLRLEKGVTLIPLKFYLSKGRVKVEVGLCRGKKLHDKRDTIKERDVQRDMDREYKTR